jgi:hypothetical protein
VSIKQEAGCGEIFSNVEAREERTYRAVEPTDIIRGQKFRKRFRSQLLQSARAMGPA